MTIRRSAPNREYDGAAGFEGRLRTKLEVGEPLDAEEGRYLAGLRGSQHPSADWPGLRRGRAQ